MIYGETDFQGLICTSFLTLYWKGYSMCNSTGKSHFNKYFGKTKRVVKSCLSVRRISPLLVENMIMLNSWRLDCLVVKVQDETWGLGFKKDLALP